jgi:uncharacterized protein YraI
MAHDVFISYSTKDKPIADAICANIETAGIRCWIAPRDIAPGEDWPDAVTRAIAGSRIMVLVFSAYSNSSEDVSRELFLAANSKLVIIPFKIENIEPEPGKQYYLARTHWLDAINPPTKEQIHALIERVTALIPVKEAPGLVEVPPATLLRGQKTFQKDARAASTLEKTETFRPALPEAAARVQSAYLRYLWIPVIIVLLLCAAGVVWAGGLAMKQVKIPALAFPAASTHTPTSIPPSPTEAATFTPTLDLSANLAIGGTGLFSGPGPGYDQTGFAFGEVTIIGQAYGCGWFEVVSNSTASESGWVSADEITYTVKCADVKAVSIPATPTSVPTDTPTPTDTALPPTATVRAGAPVAPPVTCTINSNILIANHSGSNATLYLTGPGSFIFNLAPDANTVHVCAGTYNYTVYGTCNGKPALPQVKCDY